MSFDPYDDQSPDPYDPAEDSNLTDQLDHRPWLYGHWPNDGSTEFPWPGYTIDTDTVLDVLTIARKRNPDAYLTISDTSAHEIVPVDEASLGNLSNYELRRLRMVDPHIALGPDAQTIPNDRDSAYRSCRAVARHIAGAGQRRIHWKGLTAYWHVAATLALTACWAWATLDHAAPAPVLVLLAFLGILALIPTYRDAWRRRNDARYNLPGVHVIPMTRAEVRAARANHRRDWAVGAIGAALTAIAGLIAAALTGIPG